MPARARNIPPGQEGFALVEVMISAMIALLITGAALGLLISAGRSGAQERDRSQAFAIAQEDQARLRTMRISELNLHEKRAVTLGNTTYTVLSTGVFVENATGNSTACGSKTAADYVRIGSEVTWPDMEGRQPVLIQSIVSPLSGSLDPTRGTLEVKVVDAASKPITGVGLSGSGPGSFSGSTDANGCAVFNNLPEGNYTLTPSLVNPAFVDVNGKPPGQQIAGVKAGTTEPVTLQFGEAGWATVSFETQPYGGTVVAANASSVVASYKGGMQFPKTISTASGEPESPIVASGLFPFSGSYAIYAGSCSANNPNPSEGTPTGDALKEIAGVVVPAGAGAPLAKIQLPPLNLIVKNGSTEAATVTVTETKSSKGLLCSPPLTRTFTTNAEGRLSSPGLPYGTYKVCASAKFSGTRRYVELQNVEVHELNPAKSKWAEVSLTSSSSRTAC